MVTNHSVFFISYSITRNFSKGLFVGIFWRNCYKDFLSCTWTTYFCCNYIIWGSMGGSHFLCLRFCAYSHFLVSTVLVPTKLLPTLGCLLFFCPHLWKWRFCAYHLVFDSFIPTVLLPAYSCPLDGKGWICAYPLVEHVFVTTFLCGKFLCLPLWVRMFRQGLAVRSVGHVFVPVDGVIVRWKSKIYP